MGLALLVTDPEKDEQMNQSLNHEAVCNIGPSYTGSVNKTVRHLLMFFFTLSYCTENTAWKTRIRTFNQESGAFYRNYSQGKEVL